MAFAGKTVFRTKNKTQLTRTQAGSARTGASPMAVLPDTQSTQQSRLKSFHFHLAGQAAKALYILLLAPAERYSLVLTHALVYQKIDNKPGYL